MPPPTLFPTSPGSAAKGIGRIHNRQEMYRSAPEEKGHTVLVQRRAASCACCSRPVCALRLTVCGNRPVSSRLCERTITGSQGVRDLLWP